MKKQIENNYKVHIVISGKKDFISSESLSIFEEATLPSDIMHIKFDNSFFFKAKFNREPISTFEIDFDFTSPPMVDFNSNPSLPTSNMSTIQIFGDDATWVEGVHSRISEILKEKKTNRGWLHRANVYDLFLWLIIVPMTFWNLYRLEPILRSFLNKVSVVFIVFFYIYVFLLIFSIFRLIFSYIKWLFPYAELKISDKKGFRWHRIIATFILLSISGGLVYDIIKGIIKLVF